MEYRTLTTQALLERVIGLTATARWYRGALRPLFELEDPAATYDIEPLLAAAELVRRMLEEELRTRDALSSPQAVRDYLRLYFAGREYESFVVFCLDTKNRLIHVEEIFRGTLTHTAVYPRELAKLALAKNAASLICSHVHPSGDSEPSAADRILTEHLKKMLALVDVKLLDHLVVAGADVMSFAEQGLV